MRKRLPTLLVLLAATLACGSLSPTRAPIATAAATVLQPAPPTPSPGPTTEPRPTPPAGAETYLGQFDCTGSEAGALAYAGRITLEAGGSIAFKDYDGNVQSGSWTRASAAARTSAFTFTGNLSLASATYNPTAGTLAVRVSPGQSVVHAEGGTLNCERAVPGKTGPPA